MDSDTVLADKLEISIGSVSRIRGGTQFVSAQMILKIYDKTSLSVNDIRELVKHSQKIVP